MTGIQFLAVAVFVCTVNWVVRAVSHSQGEVRHIENTTVISEPSAATGVASQQQDVRF